MLRECVGGDGGAGGGWDGSRLLLRSTQSLRAALMFKLYRMISKVVYRSLTLGCLYPRRVNLQLKRTERGHVRVHPHPPTHLPSRQLP